MTMQHALRWAAPLALFLFLVPASDSSRAVDVALAGDGALFSLEVTGETSLQVEVRRGQNAGRTSFALDGLPAGEAIVDGRVVPWSVAGGSDAVLLVLVIERAEGHAYRFLLNPFATEETPFVLSAPIFESEGEPWRIVEARASGATADGLEVTFRRGKLTAGDERAGFEERVYIDSCTPAGVAGSKLFDVRSGERVPQ